MILSLPKTTPTTCHLQFTFQAYLSNLTLRRSGHSSHFLINSVLVFFLPSLRYAYSLGSKKGCVPSLLKSFFFLKVHSQVILPIIKLQTAFPSRSTQQPEPRAACQQLAHHHVCSRLPPSPLTARRRALPCGGLGR